MPADKPSIAATDVPFKTISGRAEVVRRGVKLAPLERTLLIMVDGRQNVAALFAALGRQEAADGAGHAALHRLAGLGLLALRTVVPAQPAVQRRSLALARLYLIDSVERALRGRTDELKPLLRAADDEASLLRALEACERVLGEAGATGQAGAIRARCLELLPLSPTGRRAATDR